MEIVGICINCVAPGSLLATFTVIMIGSVFVVGAEMRKTKARSEATLADPHQVLAIIATAIRDAQKDHPDGPMDPEEAKHLAKCICTALAEARLQIAPIAND